MSSIVLFVSALLGIGFGFAAQRGSICAVRGVREVLEQRSLQQMRAVLLCMIWVVATAVPLVWLDREAHLAPLYAAGFAAFGGGLLFGVGAALNGSCSFGTLIGLGAGDLSYLGTLAGLAIGFALQPMIGPPAPLPGGPGPLETPGIAGLFLVAAAWIACAATGAPARLSAREWTPAQAAAWMGITGGLLYALHGSWAYTVTLRNSVVSMAGGGGWDPLLVLLFAACVAGAALAARGRSLKLRLDPAAWPARLSGGTVMGLGAAYVPGGNDALILHGAPALSPHVLVAYPALVLGIAVALLAGRAIRRLRPAS